MDVGENGVAYFRSGDEVAFFTGVLAEASLSFRMKAANLLELAATKPQISDELGLVVDLAAKNIERTSEALAVTADAIDAALSMSAGSAVAYLDLEKLKDAVRAFARYRMIQEHFLDDLVEGVPTREGG